MDVEISNPIEEACTEFGSYLNITGTAEAASNALLNLFLMLEKPEDPLEFVRENLDPHLNVQFAKLKVKVESTREELNELNELIADLKAKSIKLIEEQAAMAEGAELLEGDAEGAEGAAGAEDAEGEVTESGTGEGNPETEEKPSEESGGIKEGDAEATAPSDEKPLGENKE